jgi:hypothetical protein
MIASMLLDLVGVDRESIFENYEAGVRDDNTWLRTAQTKRRDVSMSDEALHEHLESARIELAAFLDAIEVEPYLLASGVTPTQVKQLRSRLLDP